MESVLTEIWGDSEVKSMKLTVDVPLNPARTKEYLLGLENPKYEFIEQKRNAMTFEVNDADGSAGDLVSFTKATIKSQPWGAALYFRVLKEGQLYSTQKV